MKNQLLSLAMILTVMASVPSSVLAEGFKEGASSLFLPTTGQAMNGELGNTKTKVMAGIEVAAVTTVTILGLATGGGVVWVGLGPLIANHLWSATDAYKGAHAKQDPLVQQQLLEAQQAIEFSRNRRFDRVQTDRTDIRQRVQMAGEHAYN